MKRILSVFLLLALVLTLFVSCNSGEGEAEATKVDVTTAHEHVWGELVTVKRPNCVEQGLQQRSCPCGATEDTYIDASGIHTYRDKKCIYCGISTVTINSVSLEKFVIVYANNSFSEQAAEDIAKVIKERQGYELSLRSGAEAESEYEIIVGNLPRDISYETSAENMSECFEIAVAGKKLAVLATNEETMSAAVSFFKENFLKSSVLHLTDEDTISYNRTHSIYNKSVGDIRIFCNNVLYSSPSVRARDFFETLDGTGADIMLLQEVSVSWYEIMQSMLVGNRGYKLVPTSTDKVNISPNSNYTPIFYRSDRLELTDYGYDQFETAKSITHNTSKSYTWAVFKDKQSGKSFCAISTHFTWAEDNHSPSPDEMRQMDAKEMLGFIKTLKDKYGEDMPILLMGDLNCDLSSAPYNILLKELTPVRTDNKVDIKHNIDYITWHELGNGVYIDKSGIIDHAFVTGAGFAITKYQHIIGDAALAASDHVPIMLDFCFE